MTAIMILVTFVVVLGGGVIFLSWLIWGSSYFDEGPAPKARSEGENGFTPPKAEGAVSPGLYLPCPICRGIEGCDHSVPERRRAYYAQRDAASKVDSLATPVPPAKPKAMPFGKRKYH